MSGPRRVTHVMGGAALGGTERQLLLMLDHLDRSRWTSSVVLLRGGPLQGDFARRVPTVVLPKRGKVDPLALHRLVRTLRGQRPDVVTCWGSTGILWGTLAAHHPGWRGRQPRVVTSDRSLDEWKWGPHLVADRLVYRIADRVTGNAQAVVDAAVGRGAPRRRTGVVANGVVVPPLPAQLPAQGGFRGGTGPRLLCLARFDVRKGQDDLVRAMPAVLDACPGARLRLVGPVARESERVHREAVRRLADGLGIGHAVALLDGTDSPEDEIRAADLVVSASRSEGLPNVVMEAMSWGVPVVATRVGGTPDLVEHGVTGWLVPPGDPSALAHAILDAVAEPALLRAVGAGARTRVEERFAADRVAEAWMRLWDGVAAC